LRGGISTAVFFGVVRCACDAGDAGGGEN